MKIENEILDILKKNQEEFKHARDTLKWLLVLKPSADRILRIAALSHDIERAITPWKNITGIHTKKFRKKHAERSSRIMKKILKKYNFNKFNIERVTSLILKHEVGRNEEQNLIKDADSLSNFQWCDDFFKTRELEEIKLILKEMYERMSIENITLINQIKFKNKEVRDLLKDLNILKNNIKNEKRR